MLVWLKYQNWEDMPLERKDVLIPEADIARQHIETARELGMDSAKLNRFFIDDCGVIPNDGASFGEQGRGFVRLNFAMTHANLREAVRRIGEAVEKR